MTEPASDSETHIAAERDAAVREAFEVIAAEIGKLRGLDLGDHPPAVVFRPLRRKDPS
ncbi:hypothetical protein JL100_018960 [Skermanella mucosa]|uniref:hypothetical protein n=1 Tax=Skermanella mucosa TaxID=1789672 RepID=UPI00192C3C20|nr:hypothetical protein [Skermanella mucosa]UEM19167.1 hypothetical protein JL100_018960 [Skermanella mucosa]